MGGVRHFPKKQNKTKYSWLTGELTSVSQRIPDCWNTPSLLRSSSCTGHLNSDASGSLPHPSTLCHSLSRHKMPSIHSWLLHPAQDLLLCSRSSLLNCFMNMSHWMSLRHLETQIQNWTWHPSTSPHILQNASPPKSSPLQIAPSAADTIPS